MDTFNIIFAGIVIALVLLMYLQYTLEKRFEEHVSRVFNVLLEVSTATDNNTIVNREILRIIDEVVSEEEKKRESTGDRDKGV